VGHLRPVDDVGAIIILNVIADLVVMAFDPTLAQTRRGGPMRLVGRTA